jgi:hypothetical protein
MMAQESVELTTPSIANDTQIDGDEINQYWNQVRETLLEVFKMPRAEAENAVRDLRRRLLEEIAPDGRIYIYHADPFQVAADLAGRDPQDISHEEKEYYIDRILKLPEDDRPDPSSLRRLLPDDLHPRGAKTT